MTCGEEAKSLNEALVACISKRNCTTTCNNEADFAESRGKLPLLGDPGRVVNVSSIIGFTGYSGLSVYAATKASMLGFTRSLAREVGRLGITVNAVAPGFIDTDMTHGLAGEQRQQVVRRSALRRLAEVEDVANAVEYLLSDKARNISGTVLTVDAGATA